MVMSAAEGVDCAVHVPDAIPPKNNSAAEALAEMPLFIRSSYSVRCCTRNRKASTANLHLSHGSETGSAGLQTGPEPPGPQKLQQTLNFRVSRKL